jgi:hypothetical protein
MNKRKHEEEKDGGVKRQCTTLIVEPCKAMVVWEPPFNMKSYCEDYEWRVQDAQAYIIEEFFDALELMKPLKELYYFAFGPPSGDDDPRQREVCPDYWFMELAYHQLYKLPNIEWDRTHGRVRTPHSPSHT